MVVPLFRYSPFCFSSFCFTLSPNHITSADFQTKHEISQRKNPLPVSVVDQYPYVFGPGSVSQRYGSGSFYHQTKIHIVSKKQYGIRLDFGRLDPGPDLGVQH